MTFLACFSQHPAPTHYRALKDIVKYLCSTLDWGLIYHRSAPCPEFPIVPLPILLPDPDLPPFPTQCLDLVCFLDAAHVTDTTTRCSVTGVYVHYAGAVITYKTKLQGTVATSNPEAKFIASVFAAKLVKYLCTVLTELGFPSDSPMPMYVDNQAPIAMVNDICPTPSAYNIDVQHCAIQE